MNLEVVTVPVSDVDRAKRFYQDLAPPARQAPGRWLRTQAGDANHRARVRD